MFLLLNASLLDNDALFLLAEPFTNVIFSCFYKVLAFENGRVNFTPNFTSRIGSTPSTSWSGIKYIFGNMKYKLKRLSASHGTAVKHLPHHPEVVGSNPASGFKKL